jgi:hypothetical protein
MRSAGDTEGMGDELGEWKGIGSGDRAPLFDVRRPAHTWRVALSRRVICDCQEEGESGCCNRAPTGFLRTCTQSRRLVSAPFRMSDRLRMMITLVAFRNLAE